MYEDAGAAPIGRAAELSLITRFLRTAKSTGAALIVSGEPGAGKTFLLDEAAKMAAASGITVLRGWGVQAEADVAFGVLNQVLLPLTRYSSQLEDMHRRALEAPLGSGDGVIPDRLQVSAAVIELLRRARTGSGLILIIDDLPLLDRLSADVLGFLARRTSGSRIGFLASSRRGAGGFFDTSCFPVHELAPLTEAAADELLTSRFPALEAHVRSRVLAEARGNPLALLDLPEALSEPQRAGSTALPSTLPLTPRLLAVFSGALAALPESAQRLLLFAALDGTGDVRVLTAARGAGTGPDPLAAAERAHLLHLDEAWQRLVFAHPLVRSAVIDAAEEEEERRAAHRELAALFSDDPDRSAWHLAAAGREPDEHIAAQLETAALHSLCRGDAAGAVAALTRASELSEDPGERARRLARAAVTGVGVSGERLRASSLLIESLRQDGDGRGSLEANVAAAYLLISHAGDIDTAHRLLVGAIDAVPQDAGDKAEAALYALMLTCFYGGRPELWTPFHQAVERFGPGVPDTLRICNETVADPVSASQQTLSRLSTAIHNLPADPVEAARVGFAADFVDRLAGCRAQLRKVVRDGCVEGGPVVPAIFSLNMLGTDHFQAGQWDRAADWAAISLRLCEERDYILLAHVARFTQASLAAAQGDFARARAVTDEMLGWAVPRQVRAIEWYAWQARTLAAAGAGDFDESYRCATQIASAGHLPSHIPHVLYVALDVVESCVRTCRRAEAAAHVAAMEAAGIAGISPRLRLLVTGCKALVTTDARAANDLFAEALAVPESSRWPFEHARVQLLYGERLRRAGATRESRAQLTAALELFQWLGAHPWASRALTELRASGQARMRIVTADAEPLTAREQQVAALAAGGLRNKDIAERLFLSERTVATHLRRAFPKLGVTSRAALREALASAAADASKAIKRPGAKRRLRST